MSNKKGKEILFNPAKKLQGTKFSPDIEGFSEGELTIPPDWFPGSECFFCVDHFPSIVNCTEQEYHQIQAFSNSFGSTLINESPWYQKAWEGIEPSRPMILGSAAELYLELLAELIKAQKYVSLDKVDFNVGKILDRGAVMPLWEGTGSRTKQKDFRDANK